MKLLLHACCGPCSLEPVRILQQAGHQLTLAYMNSNIHPVAEYERRRETLSNWAQNAGIPLVEGVYNPSKWEESAGVLSHQAEYSREDRCRICYRIRFEEAARYASTHGFDGICTTLSISPYQHTQIIQEELEAIAKAHQLQVIFEDFRPAFQEAQKKSKEMEMYRQNYCGCRLSYGEAAAEREERKRARKAAKAAQKAIEPETLKASRENK